MLLTLSDELADSERDELHVDVEDNVSEDIAVLVHVSVAVPVGIFVLE